MGNTNVQAQSLNGAQVESLVQIVERVGSGVLPKESAKAILLGSFSMDINTINSIIDPIMPNSLDLSETSL